MQRIGTTTLLALVTVALAATAHHTQAQTQTAAKPPAAAAAQPDPGQAVNIKLDLTITEQAGSSDPATKTLSMIVADRGAGAIRSVGSVRTQGRVQINMDARPHILPGGAVRVSLGLEYNPRAMGADAPGEWSTLNEQITVVLEPGKPLVISQAADPISDRRVLVSLSATTATPRP
jgi:hypothetical protein